MTSSHPSPVDVSHVNVTFITATGGNLTILEGILAHANHEVCVPDPVDGVVDVSYRSQRDLRIERVDDSRDKPILRVKERQNASTLDTHFDSIGTCGRISVTFNECNETYLGSHGIEIVSELFLRSADKADAACF